ncbi:hypothetical protein I4U23_026659 [Adineta vaga]|nr:hypothetical protein I4U23_026659 [Adineta vaga]
MMPIPFPYGTQQTYRTTMPHPNFPYNYHPYYPSICPNSNGLLPTPPPRTLLPPSIEQNPNLNLRECRRSLVSKDACVQFPKEKNDFMTFIEQKTRPISELNPFANEFSLNNQIIAIPKRTNSSYKLIFDDLIQQSLQSIDAIKKASKTVSVQHVSTQCNQSIDQINRSTQTSDDNDPHKLLQEYTSHIMRLMNMLHDNFQYLLMITNENDMRYQLKYTNHLFDELYYLILTLNKFSSQDGSNPSSSLMINSIEEGIDRLISSTPITIITSKICLLCQKPVNDSDDVMHKLCRLLSSPQ